MTARAAESRVQILRAAARLSAEGLVARTWGNISARVSDGKFIITPSGLPYAAMTEDQLVLVDLADGSCAGDYKPSSETGIHSSVYRMRPDVNFIIHTHQYWASAVSVSGRALTGFSHPLLGKRVPCAAYGLPGSKTLRRAVEAETAAWPDCRAFMMRNHGALCLGRNMEDAFDLARALEEVCEDRVRDVLDGQLAGMPLPPELGVSWRQGDSFLLARKGRQRRYPVDAQSLPRAAALHAAVYRGGDFQCAAHEASAVVLAASNFGQDLRPYLDDLAQIAGVDVRCVPAEGRRVERAVRGRNAVLIQGIGALCAGKSEDDVEAVRELLRKGCAAWLYARETPPAPPLGRLDARLQRAMYLYSYRKKGLRSC